MELSGFSQHIMRSKTIKKSSYFYHQLFDSPQKQIKVKLKIADNFRIYSLKYYFVTYFL